MRLCRGTDVQQAMGTWVFAVFADEIQQFDVSLATLMQGRLAQGRSQARVLHGLQQQLVDGAQILGALLRLVQAQMQVGEVVMGNHASGHRLL